MSRSAVVLVTHNSEDVLPRCLEALEQQQPEPAVIYLVDSGSSSLKYLEAEARRPRLHIILRENIGFARANNLACALLAPEIEQVLFLNPDAFPAPDFLAAAAALLAAEPKAGAVSGKLLGFDAGTGQPTGLIDSSGVTRLWYGRWIDRGQGEPEGGRYSRMQEMPALCGACFCCRRSALEEVRLPGGHVFDPAFFLYKEDIELSLRLRRRGWRLLYDPVLRAWHCRGWQGRTMSLPLRRMAAVNEIRLYLRHPSPYMLWALAKYLLVRYGEA
ncbi:MAG: hypothetical protein BWK76_01645 [Desulfobulbaceae bacterium A2]|nr:MAG: hypothetical protein BWK76_01645 [Desulfobulbaceae bacterium A2]